jgi:hypothetical protein
MAPNIDPINANPQRFIGADGPGLTARLGAPAQRRVEANARVWQYRLRRCVLDIVLYPEHGTRRATHIEARNRQGEPIPARQCLRPLLQQKRGQSSTPQ